MTIPVSSETFNLDEDVTVDHTLYYLAAREGTGEVLQWQIQLLLHMKVNYFQAMFLTVILPIPGNTCHFFLEDMLPEFQILR